jgi:hypothetical protein
VKVRTPLAKNQKNNELKKELRVFSLKFKLLLLGLPKEEETKKNES